jgi:hypothetical protein
MQPIQGNCNENRDFMMRPSPNNRRMRGRGNGVRRTGPSSSQHFDSNGPDLKVRGNATQIVDKYQTLAREATTSGDPVMAENYYQHAEHYLRILSAAGENRPDNNRQENNRGDHQAANNQDRDVRSDDPADEDDKLASAETSTETSAEVSTETSNGNGAQPEAEIVLDTDDMEVKSVERVENDSCEPPEESLNPADIAARASRPRRRRRRPEVTPETTETGDAVN